MTSPVFDPSGQNVIGVLLVSVSTDSVGDNLSVLGGKATVAWITMTLVVLVLAFLLGFVMVKPFQRITRSISAVTEGYDDDYLKEYAYTETRAL